MSIFPDAANGGVPVRDNSGNPIPVSNVPNAYVPPAAFGSTCPITYLYDDCYSRISPAQINAIQSELLCFAETLDPAGEWDCSSLCNISTAFETFIANLQSENVGDAICGVATGAGKDPLSRLIYCVGGVAYGLPITGDDSLVDLIFNALCGAEMINPNDPNVHVLLCDGTGAIKKGSVFDLQYYRGPYQQAYAYTTSQMVQRNGRLYSPNAAILGGTPFTLGTSGATWREVSASAINPFDQDLAYLKDAIVSRNGELYAANADIPAGTPFSVGTSGPTWRLVNLSEAHILEFDAAKAYTRYSVVTKDGLIYRATNAGVAPGAWNPALWELIGGEKNIYKGPYVATATYLPDQAVEVNGLLYAANGPIPANTPFAVGTTGATWRQIGESAKRLEIAMSVTQAWDDGETLAVYSVAVPFTLPVGLPDSQVSFSGAQGTAAALILFKNGSQIGAVNIYNGVPSFSFDTKQKFVPGDMLSFGAETTATFTYFSLTLVGSR